MIIHVSGHISGLSRHATQQAVNVPEWFVRCQNVQAFNSAEAVIAAPRRKPFALLPVVPFHRKSAAAFSTSYSLRTVVFFPEGREVQSEGKQTERGL